MYLHATYCERALVVAPIDQDDYDGRDVPVGAEFQAFRPDRYDWEPIGYGATEAEAIADLTESERDLFGDLC